MNEKKNIHTKIANVNFFVHLVSNVKINVRTIYMYSCNLKKLVSFRLKLFLTFNALETVQKANKVVEMTKKQLKILRALHRENATRQKNLRVLQTWNVHRKNSATLRLHLVRLVNCKNMCTVNS